MVLWGLLINYTQDVSSLTKEILLTASHGWVHPADLLFWYFPVIGGISLAVWLARWTSLDGGWFRRRGIFLIPEEVCMPMVVSDMLELEKNLRDHLPTAENFKNVWDFILSDAVFVSSHIQEIRTRPQIRRRFLNECQDDLNGCFKREKQAWYWMSDRETYMDLLKNQSIS